MSTEESCLLHFLINEFSSSLMRKQKWFIYVQKNPFLHLWFSNKNKFFLTKNMLMVYFPHCSRK